MGHVVIAAYRPKPGRAEKLLALVRDHVPTLRSLGLATDRTPIMARALDGTVIEVFEWTSPEAIERAHTDAKVLAMWADFADACDYVPLDTLSEARAPFAGFEPIE